VITQQVNLYLPEFRVEKDPITPALMGQVLLAVLGVMVLVSGWGLNTRWSLTNELAQMETRLTEQTRLTDQLDVQLARRSQNTELSERLALAELRLESSQQIRDFLSDTQLGNVDGFSDYIKDLSRASFDGIALTQFVFSDGGQTVEIAGDTLDSAMVPRLVNNFARGDSDLRSLRFSPRISRVEGSDVFHFELSNASE